MTYVASKRLSRPVRGLVASGVLALGLALAACSGAGSGSESGSGRATPAPSPDASSVQKIVSPAARPTHAQHPIPSGTRIVEVPALRKTIALTSCRAAAHGWSGSGTAKNPTTRAQTYHLLVFFTDRFSRTIDSARTTVRVAGGASGHWTAMRKFDAPKGTQCVLRGLY